MNQDDLFLKNLGIAPLHNLADEIVDDESEYRQEVITDMMTLISEYLKFGSLKDLEELIRKYC